MSDSKQPRMETERYELVWPGKAGSIRQAEAPTDKVLIPCREESVRFDTTGNLYIEGDNLDVLKLLRETYAGKIKLIYIDPPYNTGKERLYQDAFGRKGRDDHAHASWLNLMYPRLMLARDLLREDGAILINIDEHEQANLAKICEELFGACNDLGTIVWDKRNPKGDARGIAMQHEYILAYAKDLDRLTREHKVMRPKKNARRILDQAARIFRDASDLEQANKRFAAWAAAQSDLSGGERAYCKLDEQGEVYRPVSMAWPNKKKAPDEYFIPLIHPVTGKPCPVPRRGWRNPPETMAALMERGLLLFGPDETTQPTRKYYLRENMMENIPSLLYHGGSDDQLLRDLGIPFDNPKVVSIVKEHVRAFTNPGDLVLDFFSGSGTTAHAVMELNAEDGGGRPFIMVQSAEETGKTSAARQAGFETISQLGRARIRRAGEKLLADSGLDPEKLDVGFRVLKAEDNHGGQGACRPNGTKENARMLFVSYPKCTTCQKAKAFLESSGADFTPRDIKLENPTREELAQWYAASGLPLKKFFNTSGLQYKALNLKDRLPAMSEEEQLDLLASDGMLVKRPILVGDGFVLVGFKQAQWEEQLK